MTRTFEWTVRVYLFEEEGTTKARATLDTGSGDTALTGRGVARCNPQDVDVPEIGDELAASRALGDLARQLMRVADQDLESVGAGVPSSAAPPTIGWSTGRE